MAKSLQATLEIDRDHVHEAPLREISPTEAALDFELAEAPLLAVGQQVEIVFSGDALPTPVAICAWVVFRSDRDGRRTLRFKLDRADGAALHAALNRRDAYRVSPDAAKPIKVSLRVAGGPRVHEALLNDVSRTGISLLVTADVERTLLTADRFELAFALPGSARPFALVADLRYRKLSGSAVLYGLQFDPEATPAFDEQQEMIASYVSERQAEMLRKVRASFEAA